jgi:hypothetical protein
MRRTVIGAVFLAVLAVLVSGTLAARSAEEQGVREALNHYLQGHATGDGSHYKLAFHPDAKILFARDGALGAWTLAEFIARSPGKPAADEASRRRRIDSIDIVGTAASAKITLEYPDVTFTDYMSLLKVDGHWLIVNKSFHADRKGK